MAINTKLYIEKFLKIKDKKAKIVPLTLNKPQMKLYNALGEQYKQGKPQRAIVLKSRQMGFSTLAEALIFKRTATAPNVKSGIVTHKADATTNLYNMFKRYYDNLPCDELKPLIKASNAKELIFDNDKGTGLQSSIKCMTAGSEGIGRSDTFQNLHLSEYAFWDGNKEQTMLGLLQAVPRELNTMIIIESTANGFDDFKKRWDDAVKGESDFVPVFCAWWELDEYRMEYVGFELTDEEKQIKELYNLDNEQIAWRRWCIKNNCNGNIDFFKQEYPACPDEAFIYSGISVFNKESVINRKQQLRKPIKQGFFLYEDTGTELKNIRWYDDEHGYIKIYEDVKGGYPYVIGGDTAGEGSDNFTAHVLDNTTGEQVAVFCNRFDEDLYAKQVYCLGMHYNEALIGLEINFSTYPTKVLENYDYPNLFIREKKDTYTGQLMKSYGFHTTSATRPVIIAELVQVVRENIVLINDIDTLNEMLTFVRNEKGRPEALSGEHDDLIMGLAIAYHIRPQQTYLVQKFDNKKKIYNFSFEKPKAEPSGKGESVRVI